MKASPVPLSVTGRRGVRQSQLASALCATMPSSSALADLQARANDDPRAGGAHLRRRRQRILQAADLPAGEPRQFELVGSDNVGRRDRLVAEELGDPQAHEKAPAIVAHHRVAGVEHVRSSRAHTLDHAQYGEPQAGIAQIAGEHGSRAQNGAAVGHPLDNLLDPVEADHAAAPCAITCVVAEQHGVDRPDLEAQALQWEHGRAVADMAVGDGRLDREDSVVHRLFKACPSRLRKPAASTRCGVVAISSPRLKGAAMSQATADLRRDYDRDVLLEAQAAADPLAQFRRWFDDALAGEIYEPNAMALATVGPDGQPSPRMVLLKDFDVRGFVFYTNLESRKAEELAGNAKASLLFWWDRLHRQVRIEGTVSPVSDGEADA